MLMAACVSEYTCIPPTIKKAFSGMKEASSPESKIKVLVSSTGWLLIPARM
jgi:hypothetical protein